eukprot:TRINITY_DN1253_c0_g1_i3.p1 TRINITY_DN1253_c0_g1~~TRINITY_DN1253_c0_g1_i3.p1  ORF type:complete len:589 (-),score=100.73 TRINITY_DN1253_c0_g1_i3:247-2013(-)
MMLGGGHPALASDRNKATMIEGTTPLAASASASGLSQSRPQNPVYSGALGVTQEGAEPLEAPRDGYAAGYDASLLSQGSKGESDARAHLPKHDVAGSVFHSQGSGEFWAGEGSAAGDLGDSAPGETRSAMRKMRRQGDFDRYVNEEEQTQAGPSGGGEVQTTPLPEQQLSRQPMLLEPLGDETMEQPKDALESSALVDSESDGAEGSKRKLRRKVDGYTEHDVCGVIFELPDNYCPPIDALGRGGYGFVASAFVTGTGEPVAVKKIGNAFRDLTDAKRVLREVVIQRHMEHPNIASIRDVLRPPRSWEFNDVYIVYDLMPSDLQQVIQSDQRLSEKHFKYILLQLLRGLKFIHSANVLHRDLKPSNILINERCYVRITDFGLARTMLGLEDHMTEYVVTRWYRAPELLLNCQTHTGAVDIWALGCIFMELVTRKVWIKGHDPLDQLRKTMERIGSPSEADLGFLDSADARKYLMLQPPMPRRPLTEQCPTISELGADLIEKMLVFDPFKRIKVDEALAHPYLAQYYDPVLQAEATCPAPFEYDLSFEQPNFTVPLIRQLIYEVACDFNPLSPGAAAQTLPEGANDMPA